MTDVNLKSDENSKMRLSMVKKRKSSEGGSLGLMHISVRKAEQATALRTLTHAAW